MERHLDQLLDELKSEFLRMGAEVEASISLALRALVERSDDLARQVFATNKRIDAWEVEIEEKILTLMATQQPVATDLRLLATMMKINYDLERINDEAVNVAQRALELNKAPLLKPLIDIPRMADIAQRLVKSALDAFVNRDVELARQVCRDDDELDMLRDQIFRELLTYMRGGDPDTVERALQLILVSRHLERMGDHSSNISENVVFLCEGQIIRHRKDEL
jgi:phosphate transport system protein